MIQVTSNTRDLEVLAASLRRWADVERTSGNVVAARTVDTLVTEYAKILLQRKKESERNIK